MNIYLSKSYECDKIILSHLKKNLEDFNISYYEHENSLDIEIAICDLLLCVPISNFIDGKILLGKRVYTELFIFRIRVK